MRNVIIALFTALLLVSCKTTLPTYDQVQDLIAAIPDHQIKEGTEHCFTEEYYSLLEHAWAIPSDAIGEIGSDEWLYYFISGNGDSDDSRSPRILDISATNTGAKVDFEYLEMEHNMYLIFENDKWVIADYDNTLGQLKEYIAKQREYFKSANWQEYLDNTRKEYSAEAADMAEKEVKAYFQKYR